MCGVKVWCPIVCLVSGIARGLRIGIVVSTEVVRRVHMVCVSIVGMV